MKKCKSCQKEIDSKATKCPHCQSDQRNWFMKHKVPTVILVLIVLSVIGNSAKTEKSSPTPSTQVETNNSSTSSQPAVQEPTAKPTEKKVSGVTMEQFKSITEGMSYEEVVKILGSEGETLSSSELAGYKTVMYQWKGASIMSNMNATFQNDKMVSKAQFGLK